MDAEDEELLLRLARAVTNGAPIEWEAEIKNHRALAPWLRRLRSLGAIAVAHQKLRSPPDAPSTEPPAERTTPEIRGGER